MFLHNKETDSLVQIENIEALIDPNQDKVVAKSQSGQEEQDSEPMSKNNLIFPSGEGLPRCWLDANYRNA
jgi:hypothetical protein